MAADEGLLLAELLCARICHDLAGPVAAVGTGAELLADEDAAGVDAEALSLLATSAAIASHRLRFLRLALGSGNASVGAAQLRQLAADFLGGAAPGGEAIGLDWQDADKSPWPAAQARLLLNLIMLARDCLPRSGVVRVAARAAGGPLAKVAAEGIGASPGEAFAGLTAKAVTGLGPRGAQGYYTGRLAAGSDLSVAQARETDRVLFTVVNS
jgi:histidine phosphotransferase ChpT